MASSCCALLISSASEASRRPEKFSKPYLFHSEPEVVKTVGVFRHSLEAPCFGLQRGSGELRGRERDFVVDQEGQPLPHDV